LRVGWAGAQNDVEYRDWRGRAQFIGWFFLSVAWRGVQVPLRNTGNMHSPSLWVAAAMRLNYFRSIHDQKVF
jgi:hypothetical protein